MRNLITILLLLAFVAGTETIIAQVPVPQASGTKTTSSNRDYAKINRNLDIINSSFRQYNSYKTQWRVEGNRLIWKNEYSEVSANVADIIFFADYSKKWLSVKCREGECMDGTMFPKEYSMALKDASGNIAPNIEEVINAMNVIRGEILRN